MDEDSDVRRTIPLLKNLQRVLKSRKRELGDNETALVNEICDAAKGVGDITRSKVRAILGSDGQRDDVNLFSSEIQVLHAYLLSRGKGGFGQLLEGPTLLRSVADNGRVAFLLPSKSRDKSRSVVHWDLHAMIEVFENLKLIDPKIEYSIYDVVMPEAKPLVQQKLSPQSIKNERWYAEVLAKADHSVVCIGSPRANLASEWMLAKMYDVKPLSPNDDDESLPFRFFWKPQFVVNSSFDVHQRDIQKHISDWPRFEKRERLSAMLLRQVVTGKKCFLIDRLPKTPQWDSWGIVAAQRREQGQIWVCVLGLEGASTQAAALALTKIEKTVPPIVDGKASRVMQYFVSCEVKKGNGDDLLHEDPRELKKETVESHEIG
jgi:hypothetical protein